MNTETRVRSYYEIEKAVLRARQERAAAMRDGLRRFGHTFKRALTGASAGERLPLNGRLGRLASPRA